MIKKAQAEYTPYQRGDLRQAFIDNAIVMVRERGEHGFSLNELARQLGVSPGAAYRHFANKEALLSAVCASGYRQLATELGRPAERASTPGARVIELGTRYVEFGVANPDLFSMMFGTSVADIEGVGEGTFAPLVASVAEAQRDEVLPAGDVRVVAGTVWMTLHGLTRLHISGRLATLGLDGEAATLVRTHLGVVFPGL